LISEAARVREPEKSFSIAPSRIAKNIMKIRMKMDPSIHTDLVLYSGIVAGSPLFYSPKKQPQGLQLNIED